MGIQTRELDVCDLKNGSIILSSEARDSSQRGRPVRLTVTDSAGELHELPSRGLEGTVRFTIPAEVRPIRTFTVSEPDTERTLFEAKNLFPSTDREFEKQFKSHRDRSGDCHVDYFAASQIFDHFTGQAGYRISAAVVTAYKAIELMDRAYLIEAESMLLRALSALPEVRLARSTRNNREHLHISLLCALYHLHLARGNRRDFLGTLSAIRELLEEETFHSYYNLAYNSALSLRLLTLLHLMAGHPQAARETSMLSFETFKLASRDADENLTHFKELRYVHDNTYESMRIARRVKEVSDSLIDKTLKGCLRVSADNHPQTYHTMRTTFLGSCELLASDS